MTDAERLAELNDALSKGLTSYSVDGQSGTFDLAQMRREKLRLEVKLGIRKPRRRMFGFDLSGGG